jgi:anti-sigma regulatory factor (Ser/Thr protein kinase)/CheY-like chemotaxis protein
LAKSKKKAHERALMYAEKAARVAHDIRSPLVQLSASIERIEDQSIKDQLNDVSQRIVDIANDLVLNQKKVIKKENSQVQVRVPTLKESIENLIAAKREIYPHIEFKLQYSSKGIPILLTHSELMRSISNLIENSVEAIQKNGMIKVSVQEQDQFLEVTICDNGKGIPKDILPMIGTKGATFGKINGSGLGIYYTQLGLSMVGGNFTIKSVEGNGTTIKLEIPFHKTRALSNDRIQIEEGSSLLILDDDSLIRAAWAQILSKKNINEKLEIRFFSSTKEILESKLDFKRAFLLTDYDLKEDLDGLDIVGRLKMHDRSLLVTGMASNPTVRTKAKNMGDVPILDKEHLDRITFEIV